MNSIFAKIILLAGVFLLAGCVNTSPRLYQWGDYEDQVYEHFQAKSSPEQQIDILEKHLQTAEFSPPPGYYAHLGLLYGDVGRFDDMRLAFEKEKTLFPEATPFMEFLLKNAKKQTEGVKQ